MTKKTQLCMGALIAAVCASGAGSALAHGTPEDIEKLDANHDGAVTAAEFEAGALDHWAKCDANHDGKATMDEMKAQMAAMMAKHEPDMFAKSDANGDGVLEKTELAKMPAPMFKKLDTDKNGTLSPAEMAKHPDAHGKAAGGMHHEQVEMKALPGDANNDGALTKPEAQAEAQKMFKQLDANGDGKATKDELAKSMAMHGMPMHGMHGEAGHGHAQAHDMPMKEEAGHGGMHHPAPAAPAKKP